MRRIWYPLGYRILHEGRILHAKSAGSGPVGGFRADRASAAARPVRQYGRSGVTLHKDV